MPSTLKPAPSSAANESEEISKDLSQRLLTKKELGKVLRKSIRSIELLMLRRQIPYLKLGRNVRFQWPAVERALTKFEVKEVRR